MLLNLSTKHTEKPDELDEAKMVDRVVHKMLYTNEQIITRRNKNRKQKTVVLHVLVPVLDNINTRTKDDDKKRHTDVMGLNKLTK